MLQAGGAGAKWKWLWWAGTLQFPGRWAGVVAGRSRSSWQAPGGPGHSWAVPRSFFPSAGRKVVVKCSVLSSRQVGRWSKRKVVKCMKGMGSGSTHGGRSHSHPSLSALLGLGSLSTMLLSFH